MSIRARVLAISGALLVALLFVGSTGSFAQDKKDKKNQPKYSKEQIQEAQALLAVVDGVAAGKQPAPADLPLTFQNHFMRSREGKTFVPYTVTIDGAGLASSSVLYYVRAEKRGGQPAPAADAKENKDKDKNAPARVEYPWEEYGFVDLKTVAPAPAAGQPYRLSRYIGVPAGEYDIYLAVRERPASPDKKKDKNAPAAKTTVVKHAVNAPDYTSGLAASSVIVVEKIEDLTAPLTDAQAKENPYTFGTMKLTPALVNKFAKSGEISWIFVIYNAQLDAATKKPDVTVEYVFHQKTKDGEKYFNKTSPQVFSAQTLPPQWDGSVANQISAGQSVPLGSFPEGDYRLEVKITDKLANKSLTENVPFAVVAGS